jgi:hypothetical protein
MILRKETYFKKDGSQEVRFETQFPHSLFSLGINVQTLSSAVD